MRMFQVCVCGQPLQLNEQPTPEPKGTEVLLKVLAAGVCHSDLHLADGWFDLGGGKRMSCRPRHETAGHHGPRKCRRGGGGRPRRQGRQGGRRACWRIRGSAAGHARPCKRGEENLCRAMRSLGVFSNGGYADYLMVPHPRYCSTSATCAGAGGAARLFGRHHLRRVEEGADTDERADGDHRRRRPRPDVPCLAQGDGRPQRDRRRHRSGQARGGQEGGRGRGDRRRVRRMPSQQITTLTNGGAWAVIDLVGSSQTARLGYRQPDQGRQIRRRRPVRRRHHDVDCRRSRCAR